MNRRSEIDLLKIICAFMVVCVHSPFPKPIGPVIALVCKISVPIFFMITGYFYSDIKAKKGEIKQIKKIGKLLISANLLFFIFSVSKVFLKKEMMTEAGRNMISLKSMLEFVFLNESPFSAHLWYLGAIFYVFIIIFLFERRYDRKKLYPLIPIFLLTDLIFGRYSRVLCGREFPYIYVRNFLFVGLPYFLIGDYFFRYRPKITKVQCSFLIGVFVLTTLLEQYVLREMGLTTAREHGISTTFLSVFVFLRAFYSKKGDFCNSRYLCWIGARLSVCIYIIHPIVIAVYNLAETFVHSNSIKAVMNVTRPISVFLLSIMASWVLYIMRNKIKFRHRI